LRQRDSLTMFMLLKYTGRVLPARKKRGYPLLLQMATAIHTPKGPRQGRSAPSEPQSSPAGLQGARRPSRGLKPNGTKSYYKKSLFTRPSWSLEA
jgi:hypothetical protein